MIPSIHQLLSPSFVMTAGATGGLGPAIGAALCPDEESTSLLTFVAGTASLGAVDEDTTSLFSVDTDSAGCD